jgi:hypothetical protein
MLVGSSYIVTDSVNLTVKVYSIFRGAETSRDFQDKHGDRSDDSVARSRHSNIRCFTVCRSHRWTLYA